jgi:hypothetical protein
MATEDPPDHLRNYVDVHLLLRTGCNGLLPRHNLGACALETRTMRSLVVLVAIIVATAAPVGSHEWYTGLRSPSGADCCNERDCRPVAYRINRVTGREEIQANGAWHPVEYDKVLPFSSPDGEYHACWGNVAGRPDFRCIMLPGMASLSRKTFAWIAPRWPRETR